MDLVGKYYNKYKIKLVCLKNMSKYNSFNNFTVAYKMYIFHSQNITKKAFCKK